MELDIGNADAKFFSEGEIDEGQGQTDLNCSINSTVSDLPTQSESSKSEVDSSDTQTVQ